MAALWGKEGYPRCVRACMHDGSSKGRGGMALGPPGLRPRSGSPPFHVSRDSSVIRNFNASSAVLPTPAGPWPGCRVSALGGDKIRRHVPPLSFDLSKWDDAVSGGMVAEKAWNALFSGLFFRNSEEVEMP